MTDDGYSRFFSNEANTRGMVMAETFDPAQLMIFKQDMFAWLVFFTLGINRHILS